MPRHHSIKGAYPQLKSVRHNKFVLLGRRNGPVKRLNSAEIQLLNKKAAGQI